ncbi:MarR family transcriptional regulator [Tenggerimyces flavus]|uniref:MarR family transcriptional regulator n=1 Tax=Tenggerimyces flavus TaxID=1708749 RepID=A0ABV7Y8I3_9ACTN|nr:MarR family transcriptional regulator [Tenggerimyces flavus]MBM7785413.1 DNA-binding MarR family transcriptional regulator [Tenggerimyces flavus]
MSSKSTRRHRQLTVEIQAALREAKSQLTVLNQRVGTHLELRDIELTCLDILSRHKQLSPGALAREAGLHPATMTGILDRLERGGWIERSRDASDRRAVIVQNRRERGAELLGLYSGMNEAVQGICQDYDEDQLDLIVGFLRRMSAAGHAAAEDLA